MLFYYRFFYIDSIKLALLLTYSYLCNDMRRLDPGTVQRILDAADIVEVVSDFVHLKRRGSGYIGLCPFHNERTPSFSVSKTKGICKCFSCGKGGSAVNFIMELEQMSYYEALKYLAKKYNIEIEERELTAKEREEANERESMLAINDFAMNHFEKLMADTDDGRNIGLAYFRERGINEAMIKRFHLGYSLEKRDDLLQTALNKGYNEKYLLETGLCYRTERGTVQDRFRGRVIYPVFTVSGKVVAFGGRTLRKDKDVAKYVNSPESIVYKKSRELYGLYQAKQSIVRKNKCILVEGYMDVISMHQSGVENVVASSGTSLTEGQIRLIHRFTENVTVIYDSDPAGIKASLRGIDMLLAEGLNIKVLLLPDGDDPDSFAQNHSSSEVEAYLAEHETDFIRFKTDILMRGVVNDPMARARVVQDIVRSISVIPDNITRTVYIGECSRSMGIDEKVLTLQVAKYAAERREREVAEAQRKRNREEAGLPPEAAEESEKEAEMPVTTGFKTDGNAAFLQPYERELLRYVLKYGMMYLCDYPIDEAGNTRPMSVIEYVVRELKEDGIEFANSPYARTMTAAIEISTANWESDLNANYAKVQRVKEEYIARGIEEIRNKAEDLASIDVSEKRLYEAAEAKMQKDVAQFAALYIEKALASSPDDVVRGITTDLVSSRHKLSKIHTKYSKLVGEEERLHELVPRAVYNLKEALIECSIRSVMQEIGKEYAKPDKDFEVIKDLMQRVAQLNEMKKELAKYLGERILSPRKR